MKFTVKRKDLLGPVSRVQGIVEKRTTMPVLSNLRMDVSSGRVEVSATDLEVSIRDSAPLASVEQEGAITVNARKLYEIVRSLPDEELSVTVSDESRVTIRGSRSTFNVMGLPGANFPDLPAMEAPGLCRVERETLGEMIDRTSFAVATDETRYNINGFLLEREGEGVRMVATDGHRLALIEKGSALDLGERGRALLPRKGVLEIRKLVDEAGDDELSMGVVERSMVVSRGRVSLNVRLLEGEFPDYRRVIPEGNERVARARRDELASALKRVSILSEDRIKGVRFNFSGSTLVLTSSSKDIGDARVEMEVEYSGGEDSPLEIAFNAVYILDMLESVNEPEVSMFLKDSLSPGILRPTGCDDYTYVIMPMRL